jgi:hypothetical protein
MGPSKLFKIHQKKLKFEIFEYLDYFEANFGLNSAGLVLLITSFLQYFEALSHFFEEIKSFGPLSVQSLNKVDLAYLFSLLLVYFGPVFSKDFIGEQSKLRFLDGYFQIDLQ